MTKAHGQQYADFLENPEAFWEEQASLIAWYKKPQTILSKDDNGYYRWYCDGELNTSYLCLDYHVEQGRGDQTALIYDSPITGSKSSLTYLELRNQVALFAGGLKDLGVTKGDRVVLYMSMVPEAVIAMLACARLGAIHSVVFGGFAPEELSARIDDAKPKVLVTTSCGIEVKKIIPYKPLVDEAIAISQHKPSKTVVLQRPQFHGDMMPGKDVDWDALMSNTTPAEPVPLKGTDPLYILYTSGTTGKPKGVVRDNGGHAVAMRYSMDVVYDIQPGDVYWAASDVGWVVGHSYIVYAPLLTGSTTILYEGKPVRTPDPSAFWRVCAEYGVKTLFTAPTAFRAIRKEDPAATGIKNYDLSKLERIYLAGERLDPSTYEWLAENTQLPIIDHWWQTETAWAIAGNPIGLGALPTKAGSSTVPMPGYEIDIMDDEGGHVDRGHQGNIVIKLPLPPGTMTTIWNNHERFEQGYLSTYPGYYLTGDEGYLDEDNYLFVMGRCDDVINIAGHRLSTGKMEEIVSSHEAIAECAVVGAEDPLKGQLPMGLVVLKDGFNIEADELSQQLKKMVREKIGAISCYHQTLIIPRLPKTRSGKILRRIIRQIVDHKPYTIPPTIDDPLILEEITEALNHTEGSVSGH